MQKTTVYLEEDSYLQLKRLARESRRTPAELIRAAVREYSQRHTKREMPRSMGMGRSGIPNLAANLDDYMDGFGEDN